MKNFKPIRTEADHAAAIAEIDRLERLEPKDGSPDDDALEVLYTLVEAYEEQAHPIPPPDPIDAIKFRMDQMGWERKDLEPFIGGRARISEVLNGTRALSIAMIRRLAETGIPAEILIREPGGTDASTTRERESRYRITRRKRKKPAKAAPTRTSRKR